MVPKGTLWVKSIPKLAIMSPPSTQNLPPEANPANPLPGILDVVIINMDKVLHEGKAKSIIVPTSYGDLALMPGHTPLFTKLVKGTIKVNPEDGNGSSYEIENGIAKATQFKVTILVGF